MNVRSRYGWGWEIECEGGSISPPIESQNLATLLVKSMEDERDWEQALAHVGARVCADGRVRWDAGVIPSAPGCWDSVETSVPLDECAGIETRLSVGPDGAFIDVIPVRSLAAVAKQRGTREILDLGDVRSIFDGLGELAESIANDLPTEIGDWHDSVIAMREMAGRIMDRNNVAR